METPLLKNPEIYPEPEVLQKALEDSFLVYTEMLETITGVGFELVPEWKYFNDGKAWSCKVCFKKKTVFWISVWEKFFKTAFYFTEKTGAGIAQLNIKQTIKDEFYQSKAIGKLYPLILFMKKKEQLKDLYAITEYKKNLK